MKTWPDQACQLFSLCCRAPWVWEFALVHTINNDSNGTSDMQSCIRSQRPIHLPDLILGHQMACIQITLRFLATKECPSSWIMSLWCMHAEHWEWLVSGPTYHLLWEPETTIEPPSRSALCKGDVKLLRDLRFAECFASNAPHTS